jgi:hypothetical protein
MHNVMHRWGKTTREPGRSQPSPAGVAPPIDLFPQTSDVVPTRYAARMLVPHKSTPPTTTGFEIIPSTEESDRRTP